MIRSSTISLILSLLATTAPKLAHAVCYTNTTDMLNAQLAGETQLEICSGTTMELGLPISQDFQEWSGMVPLVVIKDDVEIYCGPDKKSSNNCVLSGGTLQLVTSFFQPLTPGVFTTSTNNLKVTGLTFTGELKDVEGAWTGTALSLGAPGTGIVVDDCIFQDLTAVHHFYIQRNQFTPPEAFPRNAVEATLQNSVFSNIIFGQDVVQNAEQILTISDVSFANINYAPLCDCQSASFMELEAGSTTTFLNSGVTIDQVESFTSLIMVHGNETVFNYESNQLSVQDFTIFDSANRDPVTYCDGIVVEKLSNGVFDECTPVEQTSSGSSSSSSMNGNGSGSSAPAARNLSTVGMAISMVLIGVASSLFL